MPLQLRVPMEVYPFNFPIESDANNGKDFPMFRDRESYSTVRFLTLSVMLSMGLRRAVQPSLLFRSRLLAAQHCYHSRPPDPLPAKKSLLHLILATQDCQCGVESGATR